LLTAFTRRNAGDDLRAVLQHLLRVERAVATGDTLHDHRGLVIEEDAHAAPFASCTAFCTASSMSDDAENPFSCKIFIAISSLVPVSRMTIGTLSGFCLVAVTMPFATSSVRVMPPKMLNRIAFTFGSAVMILSALIWASEQPVFMNAAYNCCMIFVAARIFLASSNKKNPSRAA